MTQHVPRVGLFPTQLGEIERVVELLVGEAHDETWGSPSTLLRNALAADLARWGGPLPASTIDALSYPAGYPREAAELFVLLGAIADRLPWAERDEIAAQLARAIERIALQRLQYVGDEDVESAAAALPQLRATAAKAWKAHAGRAAKVAEARKARAAEAKERGDRISAEIRRRYKAGEQWRGMPGRVSRALVDVPLSTAGDHVRRVRAAIEKENSRH